ncbi:suppressor of tub2 mutation [Coniochaeta pulveracea]|uniref:Suppressor of tub2 mutation n=1 Tax=Coniochaeta pulveracea TaxID=177199 RepID=A0A420YD45_9PEZI|nr:suppressor of tub2 mutation [Coniochaeta pulveracea]
MVDRPGISDQQVADLTNILRTEANTDAKVNQVTAIKSGIKQHNVPETCIIPLFDALRTASASQHAILVNAGFTALCHLITRLSRQEPRYLIKEAARTLPLLVDKLGDQKEKFRASAAQAMVTLWTVNPVEVERMVRNVAMQEGLQFRSYVPTLMDLLEDADPGVRDTAKNTVIELFRNAPNAAKSDLKRQLKNFKVRLAIEQAIIKELIPTSSLQSSQQGEEPPSQAAAPRPGLAASISSVSTERPITPGSTADGKPEQVDPMYVNTQRELDDIFREMHTYFEGRETEQNWLKREESVTKLRKLLAGNAVSDFHDHFLSGLRGLLDGILKAVNSLRTSLSKEGCSLLQEIAYTYGPGMDPMVEILMQNLIKLSAATKKIASQQANATIDAIVSKVTFNARILQHIWGACQDKNIQPRTYASGWLKTLLNKEAHHKSHIEHAGGLDVVEKCIKKGLADANPGVREKMRATYWTFARIWPARAEAIMDALDATAQKLLKNDPHNPNLPNKADGAAAARPGLGFSKSTMGTSKPSLRETMLAQKRAAMANAKKGLPARPGSAMAQFSPVRTTSTVSNASTAPAKPTTTAGVRTRPESTLAVASGGLTSAPKRPAKIRPEMAARPATAGPYSMRSHDGPSSEQHSPPSEPIRARRPAAVTPKSFDTSPNMKRTIVPRPKPGHAATASESSLPTPSKLTASKSAPPVASPRTTPARASIQRPASRPSSPQITPQNLKAKPASVQAQPRNPSASPTKAHEDFTLVVPTVANLRATSPRLSTGVSTRFGTPPRESSVAPVDESIQGLESTPEFQSALTTPVKVYENPASQPRSETPVQVFEDPSNEGHETPKPSPIAANVLEDRPVNEDAGNHMRTEHIQDGERNGISSSPPLSPEKAKQNGRLLDSGVNKLKAKTIDAHSLRKIQSIIRDSAGGSKSAVFTDDRTDALITTLFDFLESPLGNLLPAKVQDVKAQTLMTINLLLKKMRDSFQPHVSRGLESIIRCRAAYDVRTHIVPGLEKLASDLVLLGDAAEITAVLSQMLDQSDLSDASVCLGLRTLAQTITAKTSPFVPSDTELNTLAGLAGRCLSSGDSNVRREAIELCIALHGAVGEKKFWEMLKGVDVGDDAKSLVTYYIEKRRRESIV